MSYDPSQEPKGTGTRIAISVVLMAFSGLIGAAAIRYLLGYGFGG